MPPVSEESRAIESIGNDDELERYARELEASGRFRVLRRFQPPERYCFDEVDELERGVFLDLETTGMNAGRDRIIELAMVPFDFDSAGRVHAVGEPYVGLNDPGRPLDPYVSMLTGLTDEDLKGHSLDEAEIAGFLAGSSLVIAHNASFDRPFFEAHFPRLAQLSWACSATEVPWRELGVEGRKLEYIAYRSGIYFDGHRAEVDCRVGVHVLAQDWQEDGGTALARLLEKCGRVDARLWAFDSPFDYKDRLKARGYRFDGPRKTWYRDLTADGLDEEKEWLARNVYKEMLGRRGSVRLGVAYVTARERFRPRLAPSEELLISLTG